MSAEKVEAARSTPPFRSDRLLELTLSADFGATLDDDRGEEEGEERPATLTLRQADGSEVASELRVQTRGDWRRERREPQKHDREHRSIPS